MIRFYTPWRRQKTEGLLTFSGDIEIDFLNETFSSVSILISLFTQAQSLSMG